VVVNNPPVENNQEDRNSTVRASASFFRPLEKLEIVRNGRVVGAAIPGDGKQMALNLTLPDSGNESCWYAARVVAQRQEGEPEIQGHTNPIYMVADGKPVMVRAAREALRNRWQSEVEWFKSAVMPLYSERQKQTFLEEAGRALDELERPLR
jgi:hypothetical protein